METKSVTAQSFDSDVLQASRHRPVLVDFWAPWCGPCRMLAPTLEEIASEYADKLSVVKLNTDEEPELAQRYGIRGIPAVKLFRNGRVVAEFVGVQPIAQIRAFLAPHLPRDSDRIRSEALSLAEQGDTKGAIARLREAVAGDPDNHPAILDLVRLLALDGQPEEAQKVFDQLPAAVQLDAQARAIKAHIHMSFVTRDAGEDPTSLAAQRAQAARALMQGDATKALDQWFALMEKDRRFARGDGRADVLNAFELIGNDDPRVTTYRRRLANLLN